MANRTSLNGLNIAGSGTQIDSARFSAAAGHTIMDETTGRLLAYDETKRNFLPVDSQTYWSASAPRLITDHFASNVMDDRWALGKGNDAQAADFTVSTTTPGTIFATTGDAGTGVAADAVAIAGPLSIEAEEGTIRLACRVKISAITTAYLFVGLTDVLPSTTLELPVECSAADFTTNATDAVGFLFDTSATVDQWKLVGVADDVDATHVLYAVAPVADTWTTLVLEVSDAGVATFWVDGTLAGTLAAAVTPSVDLCPIVVGCARSTSSRTVTVDLLACS